MTHKIEYTKTGNGGLNVTWRQPGINEQQEEQSKEQSQGIIVVKLF